MQTAVQEINTEYDNKLLEIRNGTTYDVLEMSGSRAVWKEVLSVYSVNREMVDRSDLVVCCIEHNSGGAFRTVQYAKKKNKEIVNLSDQ